MARTSRVALVKGDDRYDNVRRALELIAEDIPVAGVRRILIKPNFVSVERQLAATHVDAVRALLDFLRQRTSAQIFIAEGSGTGQRSALIGFRKFGYLPLIEQYGVCFVDLNSDRFVTAQIFDRQLRPLTVRVARTVVDCDYRISVGPPKTHDVVIITASLKNMVMGSLLRRQNRVLDKMLAWGDRLTAGSARRVGGVHTWVAILCGNDKLKMHQSYAVMHLNLCQLARLIPPHLSVVDGLEGMEGKGPAQGDEVALGVAVASTDFVAADCLTARLMGFDPAQIGYLFYCQQAGLGQGDVSKLSILGEEWQRCVRRFRPHPAYQQQLAWTVPGYERYLAAP